MSQPPKTMSLRSASGTNSLIFGERPSVRLPSRIVPICVSDPIGGASPFLMVNTPATVVVADERDAARAHGAAASAGVLVDVKVAPLASLPFDGEAFDLVVVHGVHGLVSSLDADARLAAMREWRRVLRQGGRVMTIEAGPAAGLAGGFKRQAPHQADEGPRGGGGGPGGGRVQTPGVV